MDNTNFIKNYYRSAIVKLRQFHDYYGKIVNIGEELKIPNEFKHEVYSNCMFLPNFDININAPIQYFIEFMNYYTKLMPELSYVLANEQRINDLYNRAFEINALDNEESLMKYIDLVVSVGIKALSDSGILE